MSFHEDLIPLFKRDLAAVLAIVPDAIYVGDQPQKITRQGLEVWVEPGAGGVAQVGALKVHPFVLHVRLKTRRGPSLTGADEIARVRSALERPYSALATPTALPRSRGKLYAVVAMAVQSK